MLNEKPKCMCYQKKSLSNRLHACLSKDRSKVPIENRMQVDLGQVLLESSTDLHRSYLSHSLRTNIHCQTLYT